MRWCQDNTLSYMFKIKLNNNLVMSCFDCVLKGSIFDLRYSVLPRGTASECARVSAVFRRLRYELTVDRVCKGLLAK